MKQLIDVVQSERTTAEKKNQKTFIFWDSQIRNLNACQVVIITTLKETGAFNAAPKSLNMYCCDAPNLFAFCCGNGHHTYDNILREKEFAVNYPTIDLEKKVWSLNRTQEPEIDEIAAAGLTPEQPRQIKAPLIAECPVNIECVLERVIDFYPGMSMIIGEVVSARIHPVIASMDRDSTNPFAIDRRNTYFYLNNL